MIRVEFFYACNTISIIMWAEKDEGQAGLEAHPPCSWHRRGKSRLERDLRTHLRLLLCQWK